MAKKVVKILLKNSGANMATNNTQVSYQKNKNTSKETIAKEGLVGYYNKNLGRMALDNVNVHKSHRHDATILGDAMGKPENLLTPLQKMDIIRVGVSKKDLETLKRKTSLDYDKLARALSVTRATLINKKGKEKFNAVVSERIVSLADIYSYGYEVFDSEENFNRWMFRPNQALGGQVPYSLVDNQFGREEVKNIIGRIAYGVFS